jgi:hypothetical protein
VAIVVVWDDVERTVIRQNFIGRWTWDELYLSLQEVNSMLMESDHPVFLMIDMHQSKLLPAGAMAHTRTLDHWPSRLVRIVAFGVSPLIEALFGIVTRIRPTVKEQISIVRTEADAHILIENLRHQLAGSA